jgi:hypothetical protein
MNGPQSVKNYMNRRLFAHIAAAIVCTIISVIGGRAQVELVPAGHRVYEFIHRMQVRGIMTEAYTVSALPYDRKEVARFLGMLLPKRDLLSPAENSYLDNFLSEFSYELGLSRDERLSLYSTGAAGLFRNKQKYLFRYEDTDAVLSVHLLLAGEPQRWKLRDDNPLGTSLWHLGGGLSGSFGGWLGFSLFAENGYVAGSREAALQNIKVRRTYKITEPDSRFFDETSGYIRIRNDWGNVIVGRNRIIYGSGRRDAALQFSDYSPEMDYLGMQLTYKGFSYHYFHGWLLGDPFLMFNPVYGYDRYVPDKYVSYHRFGFSTLRNRLNIAFSEIIVYGERGIELAYLNPFIFFKSAEHSLLDRDKAMLGFEIRGIPVRSLELFGEILIDDLAFNKLGTDSYSNQFAFRLGGSAVPELFVQNALVSIDYTKILPYVYTHRLDRNAFTHNGFPLGDPAGPNSDSWNLRWKQILSGTVAVEGYARMIRKGHNITDEEGIILRNVGGDIRQGYRLGDSESVRFLDGNVEKTGYLGVLAEYEPVRQFFIRGGVEYSKREELWNSKTFNELFMFGSIELRL